MLGSAVIFFREILEICLILSAVLAATRQLPGKTRWIALGIGAGLAGSAGLALGAKTISNALEGSGQEILNAIILFTASLMIAWTVIWMRKHGREMAVKMRALGHALTEGSIPLYALAIVIGLTILREGSEIVLFSFGLLASGTSVAELLLGALLGFSGGLTAGILLYLGLLRISPKHLFSTTGWLLTLLCGGMVSQSIGYLSAAGWNVPMGNDTLWDSSGFLSQSSLAGQVLHVLVGYTERPTAAQLIAYLATIATITLSIRLVAGNNAAGKKAAVSGVSA